MDGKRNKIRRSDRQESDINYLLHVLETSMTCTIAISSEDYPWIHSTFFVFDKENQDIVFHFSKYGYGGQQIQNDKKISISIFKYGKLYAADKAVDFGGEYQSIIVYGKVRIIENETEKMDAMKLFFNKYFGNVSNSNYKSFTPLEAHPIYVIKVKIEEWFGKQHLVPEKANEAYYSELGSMISFRKDHP